ncbi:MAG: HEXXH motif-containing putative peptide modification protein [Sphingomicrobium sp.]
MRNRLAQSLSYVFDRIGHEIGVSPDDAARTIGTIRSSRQSPHVFGAYYEMILAVERDEIDLAREFASEIVERCGMSTAGAWVRSLTNRERRDEARYRRMLLPEDIVAEAPDDHQLQSALERIDSAMGLLDRGFPEMADEIRALLGEVVIAVGPEDPKALTFDGSSSYMLWGAIMLNARGQMTVLDTAQALAHESGHNLLFGKCANGPLVENDDEEDFAHPLRTDPRPMDGVFHAAYVIARMHQTLERLLDAGVLDDEQREAAERDRELHRRNFAAADEIIRSAAQLSPVGEGAIAAARAHLAVPA